MKALTFHGKRDVRVDTVPDPLIEQPTDVVIRVTSTGLCGSDLHLYEVLGPFIGEGDILGHEPMGVVEAVGDAITEVKLGDRVVIPFNISCGHCWMCGHGLQSQCETTQVRDQGMGAALFGYTKLYGQVAGGQAEFLRVPQAQYGPIKVPDGPPDDRFLFLSDVLPTAWQAVQYAELPDEGTVVVIGLGPIGEMSTRIAQHLGASQVIGLDLVPERLARAQAHGVLTLDVGEVDDVVEAVRELTGGRGPDAVIDAVGMEAHGAPGAALASKLTGLLPDAVARRVMQTAGVDRLSVFNLAVELVRRGGTVSLSGVYGGAADPVNLLQMFDKQLTLRMGQANVRHWIDDIMPLLEGDDDPLGVDSFATHHLPLTEAPAAYEMFQKKQDGAFKVVFKPGDLIAVRVVVTGATGNVGTSVVAALAADERVTEIVGIARRLPSWRPPRTRWVSLDVARDDLAPAFAGADAVIHLAWLIQPSRDEAELERVNVHGSRRVFEAAAKAGVPALVHASSVGVYSLGPKDRAVDESWPREGVPSLFYSRHKAQAERMLDELEVSFPALRVVRLRPGLIFKREAGPEIRRLFAGPFLPTALLRPGRLPVLPLPPRMIFQCVHATDVGEAYRLAALSPDARGAYNIAANPVMDEAELVGVMRTRHVTVPARLVRALADLTYRARLHPAPPGWLDMGLAVPTMDTRKAREQLGWKPRWTAEQALLELVVGMREPTGAPTPPLTAHAGGRFRLRELRTGVGARR